MVPSLLPLTTRPPSALSATAKTTPVCPSKVASGRPLGTSQSLTVMSKLLLASSRPSPLSATPKDPAGVPFQGSQRLSAGRCPEHDCPVIATAGHEPPIIADGHPVEITGAAPREWSQQIPRRVVTYLVHAVVTVDVY